MMKVSISMRNDLTGYSASQEGYALTGYVLIQFVSVSR
jgi:NAD/NADP transhydrogenase beta subunit